MKACHGRFYAKRCLVCEELMQRKAAHQLTCGRRKCASELRSLRAHHRLGRFRPETAKWTKAPDNVNGTSENPMKIGVAERAKSGVGWRILAGPTVDIRPATIGAEDTVKAADRANRKFWRDAGANALFQRDTPPVNVIAGYRFPDAPVIDLGKPRPVSDPIQVPVDSDPLAIPHFLRRQVPAKSQESWK